jgi:hypothetical protein
MRTCLMDAGALITSCAPPRQTHGPTAQIVPIIGTWRLESLVDTLPDGSVYLWLGRKPSGEIRYDGTGHMAVQFMRDPRPTVATGKGSRASPLELRALYEGYYAYFGRYELSTRADSVTHFVQARLQPEEVGIVYRRAVQLRGDHLLISLEFIDSADSLRHRRFLAFTRVR